MDNFVEVSDAFRRASLASISKVEPYSKKTVKDEKKPKDVYFLVHILFLLFGLLHLLPYTFFLTANDYWMYKFRDPSFETVDANNKTTLQTYFASGCMISQSVPMVICMLLSTTFGHRFRIRPRILTTMTIILSSFVLFTAFIKINTDTWQTGFFAITMAGLAIIIATLTLFQISTLVLIPKFPPQYMKTFLLGQGVAGIFNATLQIISLAIGTSTEVSALGYFITGALVIASTLTLYFTSKHLRFFRYYVESDTEDTKKTYSRAEIKSVGKDIWTILVLFIISLIPLMFTHPCLTALVVSENYGNGEAWNDKYFVTTTTYLFTDTCSLFGRLSATDIIRKSTGLWWVLAATVRCVVFILLIMFCNIQPRSHLSVLFPHDWEYILILAVFFFTSGYLFNAVFLSISRLSPGNEELAYLILMSCAGVSGGLFSTLSLLSVHLV